MMYDLQETTDAMILAALKRNASPVCQVGPGTWNFHLSPDALCGGTARVRSGVLTLDLAPPRRTPPADPWALLCRNVHVGAGVKFVLDATDRAPRLLGELPLDLDEPADLEDHVGALVARVKDASARYRAGMTQAAKRPRATAEAPPAPVARLCEEAGWPFTERSEGRIAVTLEAQRRTIQAVIEPTADGGVTASAELIKGDIPPADANRRALAVLLLAASGSVRLARAAALEQPEGGVATRFESVLPPACGAQHLHYALSALSVACQLCAVEAELLHDNAVVAQAYLVSWDGPRSHVRSDLKE